MASTQQAATKEVAALPLLAAAAGGQEGRGKLEGERNNSCAESISTPRIMTPWMLPMKSVCCLQKFIMMMRNSQRMLHDHLRMLNNRQKDLVIVALEIE